MKVIIPLAGKGSRMRPHTHTKPKPLLPVAGKPAIEHIFEQIAPLKPTEYIFITGHLKDVIEDYITQHHDFKATFIEQKTMDGTASAINLAKKHMTEEVLIVFCDTLFQTNLEVLLNSEDDGILWAQEVEDYQRFGVMVVDENNHMTKIVEKPNEPISKLANIGLYYIKNYELLKQALEKVCSGEAGKGGEYWLTDAFDYMIQKGANMKVVSVHAWYDTGKPETTLESNAKLLKHEVRTAPQESVIHEPVYIGDDCEIENSVIGPNVTIMNACTIKNAVLRNCIIDEETTIENITLSESIIGCNTTLEGSHKDKKATMLIGDHGVTKLQ